MSDIMERLGKAEDTFKLGYNSGYQDGFKDGFAAAIDHIRKSLSTAAPNLPNYEIDVRPDRRDLPGYPDFS